MSVYGAGTAAASNTINYDALLTTSMFNYQRTLTDNVSKSNALFYKIQENGMYESQDGGIAVQVPLMTALGTADWYSGYDTLAADPTDGMSMAQFDWRQMSVPVSISRLEQRQNASAHRIIDLLKSKIMQAELGIKERFTKALMLGSFASNPAGSITTPDSSLFNGSPGIDPLNLFISATPAANVLVGNINGSVTTIWQNQALASALSPANKATDFLFELDKIYNNCSKGPGGPPDIAFCDQTTYQVLKAAYYQSYRSQMTTNAKYPFENVMFNNCMVVWDEFVPNVLANTLDTTTAGGGTLYFINSKFLGVKYDVETNFVASPFVKPTLQDALVSFILWMGTLTMSNRRKHGVYYGIPRSLTWSV
jgi:hypothetical protein